MTQETALARTRRARRINRLLAVRYPDAHCELDFTSPLELLVATILSAQTTDVRVNVVTPLLFARDPDAAAYAAADRAELEETIRSTGFFRAKAQSLLGLGQALVERYDGDVPARMRDLVTLPGVGRKTANVVLGNAFAVPGLPVDTHVHRVSLRLGLIGPRVSAEKAHALLEAALPAEAVYPFHLNLIQHGRLICHARAPECGRCPVVEICVYVAQ